MQNLFHKHKPKIKTLLIKLRKVFIRGINPKDLTIIVTAYNIPEYIEQCITSILKNGGANSKVIVVDDGSTDATISILEQLALTHNNIQVFHIKNSGPGGARNFGLHKSQTEFITFVDGDDYIANNGITVLLSNTTRNLDVLYSNRIKFFEKSGHFGSKSKTKNTLVTTSTKINTFIAIHGKVFSRKFLLENNIFFEQGIHFEDYPFSYLIKLKSKKVIGISDVTYVYRKRASEDNKSITQNRLSEHSIISRIKQIRLTLSITASDEWKQKFGGTSNYDLEFGKRVMRHIRALSNCSDSNLKYNAMCLLSDQTIEFRTEIEQFVSNKYLEIYHALWDKDLDRLLFKLNQNFSQ